MALELFSEGRSFIFDGVAFVRCDSRLECSVLSSWMTPDEQTATADLDRAEHVLGHLLASSRQFAAKAAGLAPVFQLVEDTGMSTVLLAERRAGVLRWTIPGAG